MTSSRTISAETFGARVEAAIRSGAVDAQKQCEMIAREAQRNPHILDGFADKAGQLEYHLFRSDNCAIKIFNFDETLTTESPVHDHAGFWAIYVVYSGEMRMAFYKEETPDLRPWPGLRRVSEIAMKPGDSQLISPDVLHSVWSTTPDTVVFTLYNGDLNAAPRRIYDQNAKVLIVDRSQWQERQAAGAYSSDSGGELRELGPNDVK
ncbi:MAG: hypothetical protein ACPGRZ_06060 [Alphaproteobacteria bacterium]